LKPFKVELELAPQRHWFFVLLLDLAVLIPYCGVIAPLDVLLSSRALEGGEGGDTATLILEPHLYVLAGLSWLALVSLLIPPLWATLWTTRDAIRSMRGSAQARHNSSAINRDRSRWFEQTSYRLLTLLAAAGAIACILIRLYGFIFNRFELPNDWLVRERGVHLFGGVSPIIPVLFLGGAFGSWIYLELRRFHSHPLLRRGVDLFGLRQPISEESQGWFKVVIDLNSRFRQTVRLLDEPLLALVSANPPLAIISFAMSLTTIILIWGVIWPRYVATPDGPLFDRLFMIAFTVYVLLLQHTLLRFLWLWRSVNQLFWLLAILPLATVFDRLPPVVGEIFGRFLGSKRLSAEDLKIPMQQCRLLLGREPNSDLSEESRRIREIALPLIDTGRPSPEIFEAVTRICLPIVLDRNWNRRSLEDSYGTLGGSTASLADQASLETDASPTPSSRRWLGMAEELIALRIIYLVSQFSPPMGILARQLIFGPLFLLLAATWYPFQPQRLIAMAIWGLVIIATTSTFLVFVQIERNEFVNRVSLSSPGSFLFDRTFLANLIPYAITVIGFVLTAFPSLTYWLGSVIEPLSRAVK
jgi:hypothetical protein